MQHETNATQTNRSGGRAFGWRNNVCAVLSPVLVCLSYGVAFAGAASPDYLAAKEAIVAADDDDLRLLIANNSELLSMRDERSKLLMEHAIGISFTDRDAKLRTKTNFNAVDVMLSAGPQYEVVDHQAFVAQSQKTLSALNRYIGGHDKFRLEKLPTNRNQYVLSLYRFTQLASEAGHSFNPETLLKMLLDICDSKAVKRGGAVPPNSTLTRFFQTTDFGEKATFPTMWVATGMIDNSCAVTLIRGET